jgi:transcriptional regulator with XRE-family HTH domain
VSSVSSKTTYVKTLQVLASNLRICRQVHQLTQKQMAERAQLDYKHYQKIENGSWPGLRVDTVDRLATVLGTSAWALLTPSGLDWEKERLAKESLPPPGTQ